MFKMQWQSNSRDSRNSRDRRRSHRPRVSRNRLQKYDLIILNNKNKPLKLTEFVTYGRGRVEEAGLEAATEAGATE